MHGSTNYGTFTKWNNAAERKKELLPFATAWMELESIMLSEISQLISWKKLCQQEGAGKKYFNVMKGKDLHSRLLYPAKLSFRMEGQMKCFSDKVKLKEFIITKPLLCEMLKGFI